MGSAHRKSLEPRIVSTESPRVDRRVSDQAMFPQLRDARLNRKLSQEELAKKLGFGQRQISDLERARVDPRLSTIRDVARVLDLELMLIPRQLISAVEGLIRGTAGSDRPLYALGEDDNERQDDDRRMWPIEVGADAGPDHRDRPAIPPRRRRRRRSR
jgi:transcriptional regulator with XRE-family HTH domain